MKTAVKPEDYKNYNKEKKVIQNAENLHEIIWNFVQHLNSFSLLYPE